MSPTSEPTSPTTTEPEPIPSNTVPASTPPTTESTTEPTTGEPTVAGFARAVSGPAAMRRAPRRGVRRSSLSVMSAFRFGSGTGGNPTYGLSAGYTSAYGSYTATPLLSSLGWSTGLQSGSFDWSYPIAMVPTGWGDGPPVSLGYSSAAVDGAVSHENIQPAGLGHGFGIGAGGFIERAYRSCALDGWAIEDLCWYTNSSGQYEFLTLVLNGQSSEMVPVRDERVAPPRRSVVEDPPLFHGDEFARQ